MATLIRLRGWPLMGLGAIVIVTLLGTLVVSQIRAHGGSPDPNIIHACASNNNVRIVAAGETCKKNETPVDWNSQGLKGDTGDTGDQGLQGDQGPKGDTGDTGDQGLQGDQGPKGDTGDTGDQGLQGDQGPKGDTGDTGDQGLQGDQGPKGDTGDTGDQGLQGNQGPKGDTGDTGIQGLKGATGDTGIQGLKGATGDTGIQGLKGATGDTGIQGLKGATGDTGIQGLKGATGDTGIQGLKGATGDTGIQGLKGATGDTGIQGLKGATGDQGIRGLKGATGDQGIQGLQGATGDRGIQGLQGATGDRGIQGLQGETGDKGIQGLQGETGDKGDEGSPRSAIIRQAPQDTSIVTADDTDSVGSHTSITIGADGLPIISYYDGTNGHLKVAHCGNEDCTDGNTLTTVDNTDSVGSHTSITIGADGLPIISYFDNTNGNLKVAHCGNVACTDGNTLTPVDTADDVGKHSSITIGADGLPIISYHKFTGLTLKVARCGNVACTGDNTLTTVDTAGTVGLYTSITIGADGLPIISYYKANNTVLKVAHCGNVACTDGNTLTTVDNTGDVGSYTSITIGADGLPIISYYDNTNGNLKVAHCGNEDCTDGNTLTTVDNTARVGFFTSITIGADGLPIISYADDSNTNLKVAHCGNVACTSAATTIVDNTADVGGYTSITIGADGLPIISYNDYTKEDSFNLKVAHCSNYFCVPFFRRR